MVNRSELLLISLTTIIAIAGWIIQSNTDVPFRMLVVVILIVCAAIQAKLSLNKAKEHKRSLEKIDSLLLEVSRKPSFELKLNETVIEPSNDQKPTVVKIRKRNYGYPFCFTVLNNGTAPATDLQAVLLCESTVMFNTLGSCWTDHGVYANYDNEVTNELRQHVFVSPAAINPKDWIKLGQGSVRSIQSSDTIMKVKVKSLDVYTEFFCYVMFEE